MYEELVGDHTILDLVDKTITAGYKYLVFDIVGALSKKEHRHRLQSYGFGNSFARLVEHVNLAALSANDEQALLHIILDAFVQFLYASDKVRMAEATATCYISCFEEWDLVSYELELFTLVLQCQKARRHVR